MRNSTSKVKKAHPLSLWRWVCQLIMLSVLAWIMFCTQDIYTQEFTEHASANGSYHSMALKQIASRYSNTWLQTTPTHWLDKYIRLVYQGLSNLRVTHWQHCTKCNDIVMYLKTVTPLPSNEKNHYGFFPKEVTKTTQFYKKWAFVITNAYIMLLKLTVLLAAMPWFILAFVLGISDGLVQRAIRRYELGRESTFLFHKLGAWLLKLSLVIWFIYLLFGSTVNPLWCLLPMAGGLGLSGYYISARFKKYL